MATNFPTSLDSLTNPTSTDQLTSPSHADQHANANDAIEALQAKVGVNSSAVTTSLDYKVENLLAVSQSNRNLLINGDFKFWQRGNSRAKLAAGSYRADRWTTHLYQSAAHERVTGRATQYAMRVSSSSTTEDSGGTRMWLTQKVEDVNCYQLRSRQVTLSFWVRFSAATASSSTATAYGNWTAGIGYYTTTTNSATATTDADSATNLTLTNGSLPTTWTKYSVTGTCPSNLNNLHATFGFAGLGNTSSNSGVWYEVAEVQLEVGSVATPFEFEDYGTTLAKCQRYYFVKVSGASALSFGMCAYAQAADLRGSFSLPTEMRTTPTLVVASGTNFYRTELDNDQFNDITLTNCTPTEVGWLNQGQVGGTKGQASLVMTNSSSASIALAAEL